jgi:hypothetical protein
MPSTYHPTEATNNKSVLNETVETQKRTLEALERIQRQAAETQAVGNMALATLDDQDQRVDQVLKGSGKLNDNLDKTQKLQNRFAFWSLQFNSRTAQKQVKREQKEEKKEKKEKKDQDKPKPSFKRRTRAKKAHQAVTPNEIVHVSDKKDLHVPEKEELFSGRKAEEQDEEPTTAGSATDATDPLSDYDRRILDQIEDSDKALEPALDAVGKQLDSILALSKALGEASETQASKIDTVQDQLEKSDYKQRVVNHRHRLFTMTRRENRNEKSLASRVALASKLACAG